jgi:hypothetical protein
MATHGFSLPYLPKFFGGAQLTAEEIARPFGPPLLWQVCVKIIKEKGQYPPAASIKSHKIIGQHIAQVAVTVHLPHVATG